jgi:hypothetical protein
VLSCTSHQWREVVNGKEVLPSKERPAAAEQAPPTAYVSSRTPALPQVNLKQDRRSICRTAREAEVPWRYPSVRHWAWER